MAFDLVANGGYGSGKLGDVTDPVGHINTSAVIDWHGQHDGIEDPHYGYPADRDYSATVDEDDWNGGESNPESTDGVTRINLSIVEEGIYGGFAVGDEILFTFAGYSSANFDDAEAGEQSYTDTGVGTWTIATIIAVGEKTGSGKQNIIVDKPLIDLQDATNKYGAATTIVAVSVPHFRNLTLNEGCYLSPLGDSGSSSGVGLWGGFILAFKCSGTLTLNGGHIDLRNKGLSPAHDNARPLFAQEANGTLDTDKYSGWENSQLKDRFKINCGDGAAFICVNKLNVANTASRIGNPTLIGVQFFRGASDTEFSISRENGTYMKKSTNIGGSTILIAAGSIENFSPNIIAKYRDNTADAGKGLAACYIASNTLLRNDEGLYAYDCISTPTRITTDCNVKSFGDGSFGTSTITTQMNNYAKVTDIDSTRQVLTLSGKTTKGAASFALGALVMVHFQHKSDSALTDTGRFILAKIIGVSGNDYTLDTAVPDISLDDYYCQIITIPQFKNYTLTSTNEATPQYSDGIGGIFAIAVSDTCDLSGGIINVYGKGGATLYGSEGLAVIGNSQNYNKLPIGQGNGSVFILAKKLIMNSNTRIGATYSGAEFGGQGGRLWGRPSDGEGGGYAGQDGLMDNEDYADATPYGGSPFNAARRLTSTYLLNGGCGSNGYILSTSGKQISTKYSRQGAHIMIIAGTITGFNQAAISTGGNGGAGVSSADVESGTAGGAGYGGGAGANTGGTVAHHTGGGGGGYQVGGYGTVSNTDSAVSFHGNGGGGSGWAFVYCNNVLRQDTTATVL